MVLLEGLEVPLKLVVIEKEILVLVCNLIEITPFVFVMERMLAKVHEKKERKKEIVVPIV